MASADQLPQRLNAVLAKVRGSSTQSDEFVPQASLEPEFEAILAPVTTVAVWGPAGASGKSTLALNLADALAVAGKRILLIDSDLVAPRLALQVAASDQSTGISAACKLAREAKLDSAELLRVSIKVDSAGSSFWLLPGISGASRWPEITPSAIEAILRTASTEFDVAIFDLASSLEPALRTDGAALGRNELTRYVVSNAEKLICLAHADAIGVHRMLRQLLDVQRLRADASLHLIVNRVRETVSGSKAEAQLRETFASLVKITPFAFLPDDPANTDAAVRSGVPVRLIRRRSPYALAIKALAQQLRV